MSDTLQPIEIQKLQKGEKVGQNIQLYAGRVMPESFGQVVEFAQMMCKGELAIPKHLRNQPGICLRVIQQSLAWEMDPWAVASKTYSVNDILAFEAQLVSAVIKKWAPIKERVIPYKFTGESGELQCSITVHHAETGEEIQYTSPKKKDIKVQNSPLWASEPQQQLAYYSIRALARRHFPEILMGVYDREEVMAMKDVTPKEPVNFLETSDNPVEGDVMPPAKAEATLKAARTNETEADKILHDYVVFGQAASIVEADGNVKHVPLSEVLEPDTPVPTEIIVRNMKRYIETEGDPVVLQAWKTENQAAINGLPPEIAKEVTSLLHKRQDELEPL